ncbi:iron ABC transporter permease [Bacteriovoracaceae bacterium]|nr:iron ABC transporter permease [Bacteriovoracaceae bacterium]
MSGELSDQETWTFILDSMLWDLTKNTLSLAFLTVLFSSLIGFGQAYLISFSSLSKKWVLHLLFVMPLIFPLYIIGFVYVGSLEYSGVIPSLIRENFGFNILNFINIKSVWGVAFVFSLALSPYIYLYLKSCFGGIDKKLFLSARSLGKTPRQITRTIVLPQALPWLFSGAILVCLEVICDFGGVSVFNYETFSTAIYHAWISLFSINTAVRLSLFPTLFALILYMISQYKFRVREGKSKVQESIVLLNLKGISKKFVFLLIFFYTLVAVIFPVSQLLIWSMHAIGIELDSDYLLLIVQTLFIGSAVAFLINSIGLVFLYLQRYRFSSREKSILPITKLGYAIPGSIVAISIMAFFSIFEVSYSGYFAFFALLLAYLIKFYSVSSELMMRGMSSISKKMDWSSLSLGKSSSFTFFKIQLPILRPVLFSSFVLVLIEVFKEMPITLILRPFGVNTLATRVYELTSEGEWERASISALFLILLGAVSLYISEKVINKK